MPAGMGGMIATGVIAAVAVVAAATSFFTVPAESQAVILRFGKPVGIPAEPGLHFKIPFGIDRVLEVPVRRQLKQEFGFGTAGATNEWQFSDRTEQELEKSMVTGDLNAALVEWVIQYRISNPIEYLFAVREPDQTLRNLSESVMREVVGDRTVDEVITVGRQEIEAEAARKLQELALSYNMGLRIDQVQLKNVNPPQPVQASFNEVNNAQQERERSINNASGEYNKEVPRARGEADRTISAAQGYALKRVNEAAGDVAAFEALLEQYSLAPEITRQRIYLETMSSILPRVGKTVILDEDASGILPFLNLGGAGTPTP